MVHTLAIIAKCGLIANLFFGCGGEVAAGIKGGLFRPQQSSGDHSTPLPSVRLSSIDKEGISPLSWKYNPKGIVSKWVDRMLQQINVSTIALSTSCTIDILAAIRHGKSAPSNASIYISALPPSLLTYSGPCYFTTSPVGWERKPDSAHPLRPAFFFCPLNDESANTNICSALEEFACNITLSIEAASSSSDKLEDHNLTAWLVTEPPSTRLRITSQTQAAGTGIGLCTNAVRRGSTSGPMLAAFARYYSALHFDHIVIHDAHGKHEDFFSASTLPPRVTYRNYSIWHALGEKVMESPAEGNNLVVRQGDQDKALTYTYCRFELSQLVHTVFIVDYDEFLFCAPAGLRLSDVSSNGSLISLASQRAAVHAMVKDTVERELESVLLPRSALGFIPVILDKFGDDKTSELSRISKICSNISYATSTEITSIPGGILSCFHDFSHHCAQNQPRNSKSLHHGLICPGTDNHAACTSHFWPHRQCNCHIGGQKTCILIHLNPSRCSHTEKLTNDEGEPHRNELALMLNGYERERSRESKEAVDEQQLIRSSASSELYSSTVEFELSRQNLDPIVNSSRKKFQLITPTKPYNTSAIHIFFILTPDFPTVSKRQLRYENVQSFIQSDPHARYFLGLYWEQHWPLIQGVFKSLRLPNAHMPELRGSRNRRGKYARWASLLLVIAYAVQFRLQHIVILEDDSKWPVDLGSRLSKHLRNDSKMVKLSKWGEGYLLSLACALEFIEKVYEIGINKHSDTWIRDNLKALTLHVADYTLIVPPNGGNIYNSPSVQNNKDFSYPHSKNNSSPLLQRIGVERAAGDNETSTATAGVNFVHLDSSQALFTSVDELDLAEVGRRLESGALSGHAC